MNKRYYLIEIILYTDNINHLELFKELKEKYDYAYILHDKDLNEDGTIKKPHYHFLVFFKNARWGNAILKNINIDNPNLIEFKTDKVQAIRYLIHADNKHKFQYDIKDISSSFDLDLYFKDTTNEEKDILLIIEFIGQYCGILTYYQIYYYVIENGLWSTYRRNYSIIKDLLQEHNSCFTYNN